MDKKAGKIDIISSFLPKPVNKHGMYHTSAYHLSALGSLGYKWVLVKGY